MSLPHNDNAIHQDTHSAFILLLVTSYLHYLETKWVITVWYKLYDAIKLCDTCYHLADYRNSSVVVSHLSVFSQTKTR